MGESTHISIDQNVKWYFLNKDGQELYAILFFIDKDGNKFFSEFTKDDIGDLFSGLQDAGALQSKGE